MGHSGSKLVVVLGMHRSGTSAVTRGLEVLGVNLGNNLYPAAVDNPKGFWEDRDFLDINEELLRYIGSGSERVGLINWKTPSSPPFTSLKVKAEKIVREKCEKNALWAFKDPRTARLLSFWQPIFQLVGCDVCYVIVTRNPMSIAKSLRERNGFELEKAFYLWLEHIVPAVSKTTRAKRVVIDYDYLLECPEAQLLRLAHELGLPAPDALALATYEVEFLDKGLRHTQFTMQDLESCPLIPSQALTAYEWLVKLSKDEIALDSSEIDLAFNLLTRELAAVSPALNLVDRLEKNIATISQSIADSEQSIVTMQAEVKNLYAGNEWLTSQRDSWEQAAYQRDQTIAGLTTQLHETQGRLLETQERLSVCEDVLTRMRRHWVVRLVNAFSKSQF